MELLTFFGFIGLFVLLGGAVIVGFGMLLELISEVFKVKIGDKKY